MSVNAESPGLRVAALARYAPGRSAAPAKRSPGDSVCAKTHFRSIANRGLLIVSPGASAFNPINFRAPFVTRSH